MNGGLLSPAAEQQLSAGLRKLSGLTSGVASRKTAAQRPKERGWCRLLKRLDAPTCLNDPKRAMAVIQVRNVAGKFVDGTRPENEIEITHRMIGIALDKNYMGRYEHDGDEWLIYAGGCEADHGSSESCSVDESL